MVASRFPPTRGQPPEPPHGAELKEASAEAEAPPEAARSVLELGEYGGMMDDPERANLRA